MLPIGRYHFVMEEIGSVRLPEYAGSTWRGALGHALRKLACVTRAPVCDDCPLLAGCIYATFFETPAPPDAGPLHISGPLPHPYVLIPGERGDGGRYPVEFLLFGEGNRALTYLIEAMRQAGANGIGEGRVPMRLVEVRQESEPGSQQWATIWTPRTALTPRPAAAPACPPPPAQVRVELLTPLRLRAGEHNVTPDSLKFADMFSPLLRRISLLMRLHAGTPLDADFAGLTARARSIPLTQRRLQWHDWQRYSNRQKTKVPMGGIVGSFVLQDLDPDLWPYLWLGQWTHAGKGVSMGLGRYRLTPPADAGMTRLPKDTESPSPSLS